MRKPVKKLSCGAVSAAIWQTTKPVEGEMVDLFSITFGKAYLENDEWKHTQSFSPEELPKVAMLANEAYRFLRLRTIEGDKEADGPDEREIAND